jgi:hypothetical protein
MEDVYSRTAAVNFSVTDSELSSGVGGRCAWTLKAGINYSTTRAIELVLMYYTNK